MKLHNKILLLLIFLFFFLLVNKSFAFNGKDYLGSDITFVDVPSTIDVSNGFVYVKTSSWGEELKVLTAGSYYYRDGDYLRLSGTGIQYKLKNNEWVRDSSLSNGSDIRMTATGFRLYSNCNIYSDKDKTGYFYKISNNDDEGSITYPKYDFSDKGVLSWLANDLSDLSKAVVNAQEKYDSNNKSLLDKIGGIFDFLNPTSDNFFLWGITNMLTNFIDAIIGFIDGLFNFLWNLIVNVFEFLFVPDEDRLIAIGETVTSKFGFVDVIKNSVNTLKSNFNNIENSPSLSIDVNSKYYTGSLVSIDMSWYSDFKPFVDTVITGFCYLFFLWRLFVGIPNIINGVGTGITYIDKLRGVDKE